MPSLRSTILLLSVPLAFILTPSRALADTSLLDLLVFQRPERPAGTGAPGDRSDGATRGGCSATQLALDALVPMEQEYVEIAPDVVVPDRTHVWGNTSLNTSTLWFALSEVVADGVIQFQLSTQDGTELHRYAAHLPATTGVFPIQLPDNSLSAIGSRYRWTALLQANCADNDAQTLVVNGWINRVDISTETADKLTTASLEEKALLYAEAGLWYDTLTVMMDLYRSNPDDPNVQSALDDLINQIDLEISDLTPIPYQ